MARKTTPPKKKGVSRKKKKDTTRLREAGRKGGRSRSAAKAEAARQNAAKGGRPCEFKPEYTEQLRAWFDKDPTEMLHKTITMKDGKTVQVEEKVGIDFPTLAGFARSIDVAQRTLLEWGKRFPAFKDAIEFGKTCQENTLLVNGMHGHYMQPLVLLFAKNNMGYREKIALTDEEGGSVKQEVTLKDELTKRRARVLDRMRKLVG